MFSLKLNTMLALESTLFVLSSKYFHSICDSIILDVNIGYTIQ